VKMYTKVTCIHAQRDLYVQQRLVCMHKETRISKHMYKRDMYTRSQRPLCTDRTYMCTTQYEQSGNSSKPFKIYGYFESEVD